MGKTVRFTCKVCLKNVKFKPKKLALTHPAYVNDCVNNKVKECYNCYVLTPFEKMKLNTDRLNHLDQIMHENYKNYCQSQYTYNMEYLYAGICTLI